MPEQGHPLPFLSQRGQSQRQWKAQRNAKGPSTFALSPTGWHGWAEHSGFIAPLLLGWPPARQKQDKRGCLCPGTAEGWGAAALLRGHLSGARLDRSSPLASRRLSGTVSSGQDRHQAGLWCFGNNTGRFVVWGQGARLARSSEDALYQSRGAGPWVVLAAGIPPGNASG